MKITIWVKINDIDLVEKIENDGISWDDITTPVDYRLTDLKNRKYNDYVQCIIESETLKKIININKSLLDFKTV